MAADIEELVGVAINPKVKTPSAGCPGLPDVAGLVVFLGPERRMAQIVEKESQSFAEGSLNMSRSSIELTDEPSGVECAQVPRI